jgi:hypothetical protein
VTQTTFLTACGTVLGREHARLFRNNQDGVAASAEGERIALVVTDGCSSGRFSEVGARFAATWLARRLPRYTDAHEAAADLLLALGSLARDLSPSEAMVPATIHDFLLFSFVAAVIDRERTLIFGAGDGLFAVNGQRTVLDPGPENAPAYLAYALLAPAKGITVHVDMPTRELEHLLLGTDGASEVPDLFQDPKYVRNPSLVEKRLRVLPLHDDTTIALAVRSCAS